MKYTRILLLTALALQLGASAFAADLGPGLPAPALTVKSWIKGTPVKSFAKDKIYVVEFWATWCGPCKQSIPHLTELAKKNKDVQFVGVSIWEDDTNNSVAKFVKEMGGKMDYTVAYGGNKDGMSKTWMEAAGQNGIPSAFIVKNNQIQWIGHPMELETPLAEVKSGKFDLKKFKAKFEKDAQQAKAQQEAAKELQSCAKLFSTGKRVEAKAKLADLVTKHPELARDAEGLQYEWLAKEDPAAWDTKTTELLKSKDLQKIFQVMMFAQRLSTSKDDQPLAKSALDKALTITEEKDVVVLFYGQMIAKNLGDEKRSLDLVTKALAVLPDSEFKSNTGLKDELVKIQKELSAKLKKG